MTQKKTGFMIHPLLRADSRQLRDLEVLMSVLSGHPRTLVEREVQSALAGSHYVVAESLDSTGPVQIVAMGGVCTKYMLTGPQSYIDHVVVLEEWRGRGIARHISGMLLMHAKWVRSKRVDLTSGPQRTEAHSFWESAGFKERETKNYRLLL